MKSITISVLTEGEGFEPSRRLWRLHTFQACSFGQLGQPSLFYFNQDIKTEAIFHFCLYDSYGTRTRVTAVKGRCLNSLDQGAMAPQVGFEPTTDRLTADSSTTELLWINKNGAVMGIEPTTSAWKAEVLPLNYTRTV